jgi:crossover junction endodeoxyribonuclease RuvC
MPTILGIDPGSNITGFGIIDYSSGKYRYIKSGYIKTSKNNLTKQLYEIFSSISELVKSYQPQEIALEQIFMYVNVNSALKLGQAKGVAIVAATQGKIPIAEYSARQVKQAVVGYGNAEKNQVQHMVKLLLQLENKPQTDEADALAIAICHANYRLLRNKKS